MLLPALKTIYSDAMIVEELYEIIDLFSRVELRMAIEKWTRASKDIEKFIPRVAQKDMVQGQKLLDCWKKVLDERDDFRVFSAQLSGKLIPYIIDSINVIYGPIELDGEKWRFERTGSGFITVYDKLNNKCYHNPADPMMEASKLADALYKPEIDEFHILGCGLGYLAYQIWIKSDKSARIVIYEDDKEMIEYADQFGVLSWIDPSRITFITHSDKETMLQEFCKQYYRNSESIYISDWKAGNYYSGKNGDLIDSIDFNQRTIRTNEKKWKINERENLKRNPRNINEFFKDYDFEGKDCVLVSAGPSLDDCIDYLKGEADTKIVIAVNTVLRRLEKENITPDVVVMLADDDSLSEHIEGVEEAFANTPLIMPLSGSRTFTSLYRGPIYAIEDKEIISSNKWNFSGTVTSLALNLAYILKSRHIYLIGSDLAYTGGRNFSKGVAHDEYSGMTDGIWVKSTDGGKVQTNNLYNSFRRILESQIAEHPEAEVYNLAGHGAEIAGTIFLQL